MDEPKIEWRHEGYDYDKGAYVIGYYENGVRRATMWGYYRDRSGVFVLYPRIIDPVGRAFPKVKYLSAFDVHRKEM